MDSPSPTGMLGSLTRRSARSPSHDRRDISTDSNANGRGRSPFPRPLRQSVGWNRGAPDKTRTCDLQVRNLALYPTELRARRDGQSSRYPKPGQRRIVRESATRPGVAPETLPAESRLASPERDAGPMARSAREGVLRVCRAQRDAASGLAARSGGGESGIRTHGTLAGSRALQARAFSRSAISPRERKTLPTGPRLASPEHDADSLARSASEGVLAVRRAQRDAASGFAACSGGGEGGIRTLDTVSRMQV